MRLGYKKRHTAMVLIIPLLCITILSYALHKFLKRAEPIFVAQSSNYSNTAFVDLVNRCIINIADTDEFSDFFRIIDNNGIKAMEADTSKINIVTSRLMIDIQNALNSDYPSKLYIPIGALTDYYLFSSVGPSIPVKIVPISVVNCEIIDKSETLGINQVNHMLYLDIWVDMQYSGYILNERERIKTTVPIAQTLLSGEVPRYYGGTPVVPNI